jgi:hypothetical protein
MTNSLFAVYTYLTARSTQISACFTCKTIEEARKIAVNLSRARGVAMIAEVVDGQHNEYEQYRDGSIDGSLPKAKILLDDDDDGLTAEQRAWVEDDVRAEYDELHDDIDFMNRTYGDSL